LASQNAYVLDVAALVGPRWSTTSKARRSAFLARLKADAIALKLAELESGLDVSGGAMPPRKRARPDGANGPVLSPHGSDSRSQKWLRVTPGVVGGTLTLHWSHGWGVILGYHARGEVRGAPARDVIGLTPNSIGQLQAKAAAYWLKATGRPAQPAGQPEAAPVAQVVAQVVGKVRYLPPGARPVPTSGKIQVYSSGRGKP
jgi:hypothetical protein